MSVAPNHSRLVMTRKTWALRLLAYSCFLVTAVPCHTTCEQTMNLGCHDCTSCSQDAFCCNQDDYCYLSLVFTKCKYWKDFRCLVLHFEFHICCSKHVCNNKPTTLTTNPSSSTPTYEEVGHGNDASLAACKTAGILGALVAFILGVIVGLLVVWLRRRKYSNSLQESPANIVMSEMVNTRPEHKDQQEAPGNRCEDVYSLAQVPNLPSDVASDLQSETSNAINDQDSGTDVYCHLRVVSEAETREYTPLTPPDQKNSFTVPPALSQQMLVSQNVSSIDEAGYARIADTAHVSRPSEPLRHQSAALWQARSPSPLELCADDVDEYNRLDRHGNQSKALSGDDNYQHLQTIVYRRNNPASGGYELATVATDVRDKTKETEAAESFSIPERRGDNPKNLPDSPSASDDHQEERLKDGSLTSIERHVYFELEPRGDLSLQKPRDDDDDDGHINNDLNDDAHYYSSPHNPDIRRLLEQPGEENYSHLQDAQPAEVLVSGDYELAKIVSEKDPP